MVDRLVAVDDADYRLPEPVQQALGTDMVDPGTVVGGALGAQFAPILVSAQGVIRNRTQFIDATGEGAATDGVTNAQPQIGAAHNLLPTGGGRVFLRKGSYLMGTRLITTKQGMVLEGDGVGATVLLLNSAAFQVGASDVLVRNMTIKGNGSNARSLFQSVATGAFKNWRFENVKFEGVGIAAARIGATDNTGAVITTGSGLAGHLEFDNCEFTAYTEDGSLHVRGVDNVTVQRSWFHDAGTDTSKGDLLKFSAGAQYWRALDNTFQNGTRDAIDAYDAHRGLIQGNTITNMGAHGVEMKVVNLSAPNPADRIQVLNNRIVNIGTASAAPAIQGATSNLVISGNQIETGPAIGIRLGKVTDLSSNTQNSLVVGNHVRGMGGQGIAALGVDGVVINSNVSVNNTGAGYLAQTATNTNIVGGPTTNLSRNNGAADDWA